MKITTILVAVVGLWGALALGGCRSGEMRKKTEELAERACKCEDKKCAEGVAEDLKAMMDKDKDEMLTEDDAKAVEESAKKMAECMIKHGVVPTL